MRLLVLNVGSSNVKVSLVDGDALVVSVQLAATDGGLDELAIVDFLGAHGAVDAVGHRIVHGGPNFAGPVVVDDHVRDSLESLADLAPLHQSRSLSGVDLVRRLLPDVPNVACFDTAFFAHMPADASTYALPIEWRRRWPLRRYGFHGLSHGWAARRVAELAGSADQARRIVTCHLGAGASLAAVVEGRPVDTTMGFTPLDGLVMATRAGALDPGLVLWLEQHAGLAPEELAFSLEHRSGLQGLAGTPDLREILASESRGDERSGLAVDVYLHRLRAGIASMAAAMGGLDALAFTGGVGERAPSIRQRALLGLSFLGVSIDEEANAVAQSDCELTRDGASARSFLVESREDLQVSREVSELLMHC